MWIALADMCHIFRDKRHLQTGNTSSRWSPHFLPHHMPFMLCLQNQNILPTKFENSIKTIIIRFYRTFIATNMDTADYWPMEWEYSIWNAALASLQFWIEDLNPVTHGRATECVYITFFYVSTSHTLCQQSDEALVGHFIIALNGALTSNCW